MSNEKQNEMSNEKQSPLKSSAFEGQFMARPINPEIGRSKGKYKVRVEWEVLEGEHKGKLARYDGKLDDENIRYTKQDMVLMGWQGKDAATFVDDVKRAGKAMMITVEQASYTYPDSGKTVTWPSAKLRTAQPLAKLESDELRDVNSWFAAAGDVTPSSNGAAKQDDDSLPF